MSTYERLVNSQNFFSPYLTQEDLSRFGRDYIIVGDYISRVFPFLGVRFISVNDGFDSINPQDIDSLDTSFRTLIYDLYSRDLSRKVRSARKARAERGAFLSPYAPYGYIKDPEDKNHLLVDEEAASVIRRIFQRAADGLKTWEIAAELNGDGVISPKNYKIDAGCTRTPWRSIQEDNFWTANLVGKFLRDERYSKTRRKYASQKRNGIVWRTPTKRLFQKMCSVKYRSRFATGADGRRTAQHRYFPGW